MVIVFLLRFSCIVLLKCVHPSLLSVFQLSRYVGSLGSLIFIDIRIVLWSVSCFPFTRRCPTSSIISVCIDFAVPGVVSM